MYVAMLLLSINEEMHLNSPFFAVLQYCLQIELKYCSEIMNGNRQEVLNLLK